MYVCMYAYVHYGAESESILELTRAHAAPAQGLLLEFFLDLYACMCVYMYVCMICSSLPAPMLLLGFFLDLYVCMYVCMYV